MTRFMSNYSYLLFIKRYSTIAMANATYWKLSRVIITSTYQHCKVFWRQFIVNNIIKEGMDKYLVKMPIKSTKNVVSEEVCIKN